MKSILGIPETCQALGVDPAKGLGTDEARKRLQDHGRNTLRGKPPKSLFRMILEQFNDTLIYILLAAAAISFLLGERSDAIIIILVVVVNAVVGVIQESKAEKALEALKKLSSPKAVVRRDGVAQEIDAEEVVPGDVILIDAGRIIPCDLRWIESVNLKVEEAALTGESVPVQKDANAILPPGDIPLGDRINLGFMTTVATYGRGVGIAVGTGMETEIGAIATMIEEADNEPTPLQKSLESFGKKLGVAILALCAVIFAFEVGQEYFKHGSLGRKEVLEFFLTAVSLAVAAIPEGLAAIVTIVLAIGVQRMSKENAIVRRLPSVETLGSVTFICSDKTGTLTQNRMTVTRFMAGERKGGVPDTSLGQKGDALLVEILSLCNDASRDGDKSTGDPTEVALIDYATAVGFDRTRALEVRPRIAEKPFDSDRKLMSTAHRDEKGVLVYTKGAVESLLAASTTVLTAGGEAPLDVEAKARILAEVGTMSEGALRVLGGAYKRLASSEHLDVETLEEGLCFVGLVGMIDPPRLEVKDSIAQCKIAGISTVMITGDHKETALAIAKELGIAQRREEALSGPELDSLSEAELQERVKVVRVFARVSPEHKVRIVKAFKANGAIVSMTGDGVNDAPSLKAADIGVAMGITGTDVAKGAADMVLTDDNFSTIVRAIEEGRNIYRNIRKAVLFLLSCNLGEILAIFVGIMLGFGSPLKPIHILWVNLVTDTLPALALCMDPGDPGVFKERPRDPKESLFSRGGYRFIVSYGILKGLITLAAFILGLVWYGTEGAGLLRAETMAFAVLAFCQLFHAFNLRHEKKSLLQVGLFTNWYMIGAFVACAAMQLSVMLIPGLSEYFKVAALSGTDWAIVVALSALPLFVYEAEKALTRAADRRKLA